MKKNKHPDFTLVKMTITTGPIPKGNCPKCERKNQRMVKKLCSHCYQKERYESKKEEDKQYKF